VNTSSTYSFSTSLQVLIEEVKYNIDNYFITKTRTDEISPIISDIKLEIRNKYKLFQTLQQRQAIFARNNRRLDPSLTEQIKTLEKEITTLNENLKYWESQLNLNRLL